MISFCFLDFQIIIFCLVLLIFRVSALIKFTLGIIALSDTRKGTFIEVDLSAMIVSVLVVDVLCGCGVL